MSLSKLTWFVLCAVFMGVVMLVCSYLLIKLGKSLGWFRYKRGLGVPE